MKSLKKSAVSMELVMTEQNGGIKNIFQHGKIEFGKQVSLTCHI